MTVRQNVEKVEMLLEQVKGHCMAFRFEDIGGKYRVIYPRGYRLDGVQADYSVCGKAVALTRILNVMERHWAEDLPANFFN